MHKSETWACLLNNENLILFFFLISQINDMQQYVQDKKLEKYIQEQ